MALVLLGSDPAEVYACIRIGGGAMSHSSVVPDDNLTSCLPDAKPLPPVDEHEGWFESELMVVRIQGRSATVVRLRGHVRSHRRVCLTPDTRRDACLSQPYSTRFHLPPNTDDHPSEHRTGVRLRKRNQISAATCTIWLRGPHPHRAAGQTRCCWRE